MAEPADQRLAALRRRWEEDRSSTAFVPLAEEYRRLGRLQDALAVLEQGMKVAPNYVSARIALGRCRLELGDAAGAVELFERVVQQDPTQLVASKLLVDAYIRSGRPQQARERLNLYAVLNDRDPELEELRRRVQQAARDEALVATETSTQGPPVSPVAESIPAPEPVPEARLTEAPRSAPEPPGEVFHLAPIEAARPVLDGLVARSRPLSTSASGTLFAGLGTPAARRRYVDALLRGEVFGTPAIAMETAAVTEPIHASVPAPMVVEPISLVPEVLPAASSETPAEAYAEESENAVDDPLEASVPLPAAPIEPTATLGEIYLSQGHNREAETIFQRVLETQPDNPAAREGLVSARRVSDGALQAEAGAARSAEGGAARAGITARKVAFLQSYLKRLRRGSERHVS